MADTPAPGRPAPSGAAGDALRFDAERLRVLVEYSAALRWQMTSIALVMAATAWAGGVAPWAVAGWLAATLLVRELRAAALLRLDRDAERPIDARLRATEWWSLALGAAYGSSSIFMLSMEPGFDGILTMILMSLGAGAVSTTFTVLRAFIGFAAAIAAPVAAMWALGGGWLGLGVAALAVMFLGVQIRFSRQNMKMFEDSYRMRLENADLLHALVEERGHLAQARDAAVAADLSKSRFLAAASHDLRQPMQSLSLNSGALSRMPLAAESRQVADEIGAGIDALRRMLDALLDMSQLDAGSVQPELQPIPLDRMLAAMAERFRAPAQAKQLQLSWHCPEGIHVVSDAQMLQRVLSNLLDNAIKYTAQGGVSMSASDEGGTIALTVADTGRGIDAADQQRVFDDLTQIGNPQRDRTLGHGLGLGIVRRLCRLLGIELRLDSRLGEGTRFTLHLPASRARHAVASEAAQPQPGLVQRRVLVLDDDAAVRVAYAHALATLGCRVRSVGTLPEALLAVAEEAPEVALVDFRLAERVDGLQAVTRLREARPGLAAILITADASDELRARAAQLQVPLLRKPVTDAVLAGAINNALDCARR
jgi:two-component system, sensor histidine kinase